MEKTKKLTLFSYLLQTILVVVPLAIISGIIVGYIVGLKSLLLVACFAVDGLLIAVLAVLKNYRVFIKPSYEMAVKIESVSLGDLSQRVSVNNKSSMARLQAAFNNMVDGFSLIINKIQQSVEHIGGLSSELKSITEQNNQALDQISGVVSENETDFNKQFYAVSETTAAVKQVLAGMQQIAEGSAVTSELTGQTVEATESGKRAVEKAINQMASIGKSTKFVQEAISKLSVSSNKINEIIEVINSIAAQTNLLALNAAIEAARAGESGRGFAVVAEEVRGLAEKSQDATKQITGLILENQENINNAVTLMAKEVQDIAIGIETVNTAGSSFSEITSKMQCVVSNGQEISANIQEIVPAMKHINNSMEEFERVNKDTVNRGGMMADTVKDQFSAMKEIVASSEELSLMAQDLQFIIDKFNLSKAKS
jgi:methyl-accepting chemotaxis protein